MCVSRPQFLRSDVFPELINHKVVKPIFAVVVALLFIGPQVTMAAEAVGPTVSVTMW